MKDKTLLVLGGLIIGIIFGAVFTSLVPVHTMDVHEMRHEFISLKNSIQEEMRHENHYRCCLEKPCTYCIEKTPGHGVDAICDCIKDLVDGVHPCGECIGEILEGHGNPYLAEYFARAISEKVGEEHELTLKKIIEEKYGIPIEEQA